MIKKEEKKKSVLEVFLEQKDKLVKDIDALENGVHDIVIKYQKFFTGIEKAEPLKERDAIQRKILKLSGSLIQGTQLKFRFANIKSKFSTYQRQWEKYLKLMEEGKFERGSLVMQPVMIENDVNDIPVKKLFKDYVAAKIECKQSVGNLTFETFKNYLDSTAEKLRAQLAGREFVFKVVTENNKVKLVAKPVKNE